MWEAFYRAELIYLAALQKLPLFTGERWQNFWQHISRSGDPLAAFTIYFPLLFAWKERTAFSLLVAACFSEFINGVLKWLMYGHRPYWFEAELGLNSTLVQYPLTCETGPGSPSGHMMVTAAIGYSIVSATSRGLEKKFAWLLYIVLLLGVGVSRLYIATHFPHQILFGAVAGLTCGYTAVRWRVDRWTFAKTVSLAVSLTALGFGTYRLLLVSGFDPDWSIHRARAHCLDPAWVHVSTTPVAALVRDIGALAGLALSQLANSNYRTFDSYSVYYGSSVVEKTVASVANFSVAFGLTWMCDTFFHSDNNVYCCLLFAINVFVVIFAVVVAPAVAKNFRGPVRKIENSKTA